MRVSMKRGAYATACEVLPFGEVEDYGITLVNAPQMIGNDTETTEQNPQETEQDKRQSALLFPNPARDVVTLDLNDYLGLPLQIIATDASGQTFMADQITKVADPQLSILINEWPVGTYTFRLITDSRRPVAKQLVVIR